MEEIVLRVRRRSGVSAVNIECEYWVDGQEITRRKPARLRLPHGVSHLTFEQAAGLADAVIKAARGWTVEAPVLFHV